MRLTRLALLSAALLLAPAVASAQSPTLLNLRAGAVPASRFRVDSSGAFVAYGFVRDVGNTAGCAAQHPTGGSAGTFFFWHPCRGSIRFGRVPTAQTNCDDANYVLEGRQARHMGPVAEDFAASFGLGVGNQSIGMGDIDGVNFAGVQALEARTAELRRQLEQKDAETSAMRTELAQLRAMVEALARAPAAPATSTH